MRTQNPNVAPDPSAWSRARLHRRRWATVLTAMATATAGWGIAESLLGIDLAVRSGAATVHQISSLAVTLTSLGAGFAGWGVLALLERWTSRPRLVWTVVAVVVFVVSLLGPLGAVTTAATVVLMVLHGVVAGVLIVGLRRTTAGANPLRRRAGRTAATPGPAPA